MKKILLTFSLALLSLSANLSLAGELMPVDASVAQLDKSAGYPDFLRKKYTGYGDMTLKTAVEFLVPVGVNIKFKGVDAKKKVSWDLSDKALFEVLNEITKSNDLEWSYLNNNLVISKDGDHTQVPPLEIIKTKIVVSEQAKTALESKENPVAFLELSVPNISLHNKGGVATPLKSSRFEITAEDESLSMALRRWASDSGFEIIWDAGRDFPSKRTVYNAANIEDAIDMVMKDTARSSYPLHACSYSNNLIRVLHTSRSCERTDTN